MAGASIRDDAVELLRQFNLESTRNTLASELSGGMRQKVAIGCAHLRKPDVLLLDEPMTGLDPPSLRRLKETLVEQARHGATVLVSSHLLSLVEDVCDHLVMMQTGNILFHGSMSQVRDPFGGESKSLEEVFFRLTAEASSHD